MKKKRVSIWLMALVVILVLSLLPADASAAAAELPNPDCTAAVLMDAGSGKVLYEKNAEAHTQPASVTKLMTALLVVEHLDLDKEVKVPAAAAGILGNNIGLKTGERLTVRQLLNAMLIVSANDAAVALAIETGGSLPHFYQMMNAKAKALGMKNTHYKSPNGLIESNNHYMSAEDTAILTRVFLRNQTLAAIVKKVHYEIPATNKSKARKMKSTNNMLFDSKSKIHADGKLIHPRYAGTIGVKTGTMNASGYCFSAAVKRGSTTLIAVVMHANGVDGSLSRFSAVIPMFDYGFENFRDVSLVAAGAAVGHVKVRYGHHTFVKAVAAEGASTTLPKEADEDIASYKVVLDKDIKAPLAAGDKVGVVNVYESGEKTASFDVTVTQAVTRGGPWSALYISDMGFFVICLAAAVILLLLAVRSARRRRKRREHEARMRRAREAQAQSIAARRAEKRKRGWPF